MTSTMHLEALLNDFAVIRTTFETLAVFPGDSELRSELWEHVVCARRNLCRRIGELQALLADPRAVSNGSADGFKAALADLVTRGTSRRALDALMKVDVFAAVSAQESALTGATPDPWYRHPLRPEHALERIGSLPPRDFTARVFDDLLASVAEEASYASPHEFDRHVFQKFVAIMFAQYAAGDPMFYGLDNRPE